MISQSFADGVSTLRLDRPEKKNTLTTEMYAALAEALEKGNGDAAVRCHVICGHPGVFTAGNDIVDFLHRQSDRPRKLANLREADPNT